MKILRPKQSQQKIGCGHTTFYELIAQGKLPPPVRYGRITGHLEEEIDAFIEALKAERDCQPKATGPARVDSEQQPADSGPALRAGNAEPSWRKTAHGLCCRCLQLSEARRCARVS